MVEQTNISALLLDMGGVFLRVHPRRVLEVWSRANDVPLETIATKWVIDDAYRAFETGQLTFIAYTEHLSARLGIEMEIEQWREGWRALVGEPYEEVLKIVRRVANVIPVYCLTNSNVEHESVFLDRHGTKLQVFRHIFNSYTLGCRKPDIRVFQSVSRLIGIQPSEIGFIDDNAENINGASTAGMVAYQTTHPRQTINLISKFVHLKNI